MDNILEIEKIIRKGAMKLSDDLFVYWPSNGNNEIPEANISMHLSAVFSNHQYNIYAEVHSEDNTDKRLDLLAINTMNSIEVVLEAKRLYSVEKLDEMIDDVDRISNFKMISHNINKLPKHKYGVIAATTWNSSYAKWWSSYNAPSPSKATNFQILSNLPILKNATWGSVVLSGYAPWKNERSPFHYFLYCIFEVEKI